MARCWLVRYKNRTAGRCSSQSFCSLFTIFISAVCSIWLNHSVKPFVGGRLMWYLASFLWNKSSSSRCFTNSRSWSEIVISQQPNLLCSIIAFLTLSIKYVAIYCANKRAKLLIKEHCHTLSSLTRKTRCFRPSTEVIMYSLFQLGSNFSHGSRQQQLLILLNIFVTTELAVTPTAEGRAVPICWDLKSTYPSTVLVLHALARFVLLRLHWPSSRGRTWRLAKLAWFETRR